MVLPDVLPFESLANPDDWAHTKRRVDCSMCLTKFTTFKRRHHCRLCGDIVCGTCFVKRKANIPMVGIIDVKVCSSCANSDSHARPSRSTTSSVSTTSRDEAPIGMVYLESRSTFNESTKLSMASESANTSSSSLFSDNSLRLGLSPDHLYSPVRESDIISGETYGDEEHDELKAAPRDWKDVRATWLHEGDLQPLRQLNEEGARYDTWVMRHRDGELLISKRLNPACIDKETVEQFIDTVELSSQLQHPHIVGFVGVAWAAGKRLQALYEYLPRGDLRTFLDATAKDAKSRQERSRLKLQMALDIAEALVHLHSFSPPLVHGSLDSSEVLLTKEYRAKLGGIGATSLDRRAKTSRRWQAPEVICEAGVYLTASDVYAFGVILCELDTHAIPYSDCLSSTGDVLPEEEIEQMVANGELQPTISRDCPTELRQLASDCLMFNPKDRPTAVEVTVRLRMFIRSYGLEQHHRAAKRSVELYDLGLGDSRVKNTGVSF